MITKRKMIELIVDRLGSSGTPSDLRRRYPFQVVEELIGKVYSDIAYTTPWAAEDLALEYCDIPVNGKKAVLPVKPVGSFGVLWVSDCDKMYPVDQGGMEHKILQRVAPCRVPGCRLVGGKTLVFDECEDGKTVDVLMIPAFPSLSADDNVAMPGTEGRVYELVIQLMRLTDTRVEDVYNDGREDEPKTPPKPQNVEG
jgi:hypothetical protein